MPGPGKRSQKKNPRENTFDLNVNIAAVNAVMTAPNTSALNTRTAALPMLLTMPEIGRFCNPATEKSSAIIHNDILRTVILELIENAKVRAFDEGKKEGYETEQAKTEGHKNQAIRESNRALITKMETADPSPIAAWWDALEMV